MDSSARSEQSQKKVRIETGTMLSGAAAPFMAPPRPASAQCKISYCLPPRSMWTFAYLADWHGRIDSGPEKIELDACRNLGGDSGVSRPENRNGSFCHVS